MKKPIVIAILFVIFISTSFLLGGKNGNYISKPLNVNSTPKHSFDVLNYKLNLDIYYRHNLSL